MAHFCDDDHDDDDTNNSNNLFHMLLVSREVYGELADPTVYMLMWLCACV